VCGDLTGCLCAGLCGLVVIVRGSSSPSLTGQQYTTHTAASLPLCNNFVFWHQMARTRDRACAIAHVCHFCCRAMRSCHLHTAVVRARWQAAVEVKIHLLFCVRNMVVVYYTITLACFVHCVMFAAQQQCAQCISTSPVGGARIESTIMVGSSSRLFRSRCVAFS